MPVCPSVCLNNPNFVFVYIDKGVALITHITHVRIMRKKKSIIK